MVSKKKNQKKGESNNEAKSSSSSVMVTKKIKKQRSFGGGNFVADPMITDPRFSPAHTDPRFRRLSRRKAKVTIDSRFRGVLTDKASAPVDKRGKKRRGGSAKDSLREYYRIEEDDKKKNKDESESEEEEMKNLKAEAKRRKSEEGKKKKKDESESESEQEMKDLESNEVEEESSEEESNSEKLKLASSSSDEKSESEDVSDEVSEEDTDEDDEAMNVEEDGFEIPEEEITNIDKETHRLAVVNMDWRHISAKDLYVVFNSFVPKDGRIVSVSVYPTELGLERMKEEEIHGPKIDDEDNDSNSDSSSEEEEDEDIINQKIRAYEITRLKYYFAVVDCDSVTTADFLYKSCDGIEFERTSNKLDIRFIPDTMEFKHPPRDTATERPSNYQGLVFQTQALQMSKVGVSWDEDEPHRAKTLNQKFNPDQLAELEKQRYIADYSGDESESNDEDGGNKYRALIDVKDSDNEEEENENDEKMDMEVTFHDGLEDLSKTVREKKEQKRSETVWDKSVREIKEKKKARKKNKKKNDSSSSSDDNGDDFFMEEAKPKKKAKKKEEVAVEEERNRAELELLLADDENGNGGEGIKGYNIKKKKKKIVEEEEKIVPMVELDQPRFATKLFSDPNYALDPTDPQFKRSATYVRQLAQKQKEVPRSQEEVTTTMEVKPESKKTERHETTNAIKSVKMKMKNQQKDSEERKKKAGNAESSTTTTMTLAKIKKKLKDLSKK